MKHWQCSYKKRSIFANNIFMKYFGCTHVHSRFFFLACQSFRFLNWELDVFLFLVGFTRKRGRGGDRYQGLVNLEVKQMLITFFLCQFSIYQFSVVLTIQVTTTADVINVRVLNDLELIWLDLIWQFLVSDFGLTGKKLRRTKKIRRNENRGHVKTAGLS